MTEDHVLKLLLLVIDKVMEADYDDQQRAFKEVEGLMASIQNDIGSCCGPYSQELPERRDRHSGPRGLWRAYGCDNHAHIINLKFGCFSIGRELAEKILVLGGLP